MHLHAALIKVYRKISVNQKIRFCTIAYYHPEFITHQIKIKIKYYQITPRNTEDPYYVFI